MGPPGGYPPRHRNPHPIPQQTQYTAYQPTPENIYGLASAEQHAGMSMGDLSGWGAASAGPGQGGAYSAATLGAYGHPQAVPSSQQRQSAAQARYSTHLHAEKLYLRI